MIQVMADAGSQEDTEIAFGKRVLEKKIRIQKSYIREGFKKKCDKCHTKKIVA